MSSKGSSGEIMNKAINAHELRKQKLQSRDAISVAIREEKSLIIQKKLLELDVVKRAKNIFIYVNFRSEVKTTYAIEKILMENKKVTVPLTLVEQKRMDAVQIDNLKEDLEPGYCGILEPTVERAARYVFPPEKIDVVVIPGSVFDMRGGRFGYGGGYYDRFLERIPKAIRIGLAFDLQIVQEVPLQSHDEIIDCILSEKRTVTVDR